jgi:hypothetical protein
MLKNLSTGIICYAVRYKDDIASHMWYDPFRCSYQHLNFKLKENEAHLYDAFTYDEYKGKSIAPYLRQYLYRKLASQGRTKLYSITEYNDISSIMFKKN